MAQCVKLMLSIFEFGVLLFDYFVYRQSVTCLKRLPCGLHRSGGTHNHRQIRSCLFNCCATNYSYTNYKLHKLQF